MKPKILIVLADYYRDISNEMLNSTINFIKKKAKHKTIKVPGIFEIPVVISKNINKYDGIISLGCVIKGETPHFEFISSAATNAIMNLSVEFKKPIGNGVITCLNIKQAKVRSKTKGIEAAKAVISVLSK
tara:strand:+ start:243 stop:632 length:390 start_codon:yes stop_codon:yes gene_type:complete